MWEHINRCQTAFGARRLRDMLCRPSQSPATINGRCVRPCRVASKQTKTAPSSLKRGEATNTHAFIHPFNCDTTRIVRRLCDSLDAIEELLGELSPEADAIRSLLKRVPDVERQLARHHALGSVHRRSEDGMGWDKLAARLACLLAWVAVRGPFLWRGMAPFPSRPEHCAARVHTSKRNE